MSLDLAARVRRLLRETEVASVKDERVLPTAKSHEGVVLLSVEWLGTWAPYGVQARQLVGCANASQVDSSVVEWFLREFDEGGYSSALFMYTGRLTRPVRELLTDAHVTILTYDDFVSKAIDVSGYTKVFRRLIPDGVDEMYVERRNFELLDLRTDPDVIPVGLQSSSLTEYIMRWIDDPSDARQLALLGSAGSGKTWACWHLCIEQMARYVSNPKIHRLPLYIRLRDYSRWMDVREFINATLSDVGISILGGYKGLRVFADRFVLVLDGFDEMESFRTQTSLFRDFADVTRLVAANSKVVLASRKVVFHEMSRLRLLFSPLESLSADEKAFLATTLPPDLVARMPRNPFEVIELLPFTGAEVNESLDLRHASEIVDQLSTDSDLADLSSSPLLLDRLTPLLRSGEGRAKGLVYEYLVQEWLRRPVRENRTIVRDIRLKVAFAEEFAWHLSVRGILSLRYAEFPWELWRIVRNLGTDPLEDPIKDDLRTQTFLETDLHGHYSFTHKSLKEFFVARKLHRELQEGRHDSFGSLPLAEEVVSFLADLRPDASYLWSLVDLARARSTSEFIRDWTPTKRYLARNSVSVLSAMNQPFEGNDLSYCDLRGALLADVDLRNVVLSGADLDHADLRGTLLPALKPAAALSHVRPPYPPEGMVLVPGGDFFMGSQISEVEDEKPARWVHVSPFLIDIHETTNIAFWDFVKSQPKWGRHQARKRLRNEYYLEHWMSDTKTGASPPFDQEIASHPVTYVSWFGAIAYCNWLSAVHYLRPCYYWTDQDGRTHDLDGWYDMLATTPSGGLYADIKCNPQADGYRLPTEAEWEYAAREGHHQWEYPWGPSFEPGRVATPSSLTAPVLRAEVNVYGVSGLVGNVREWCNDWYAPRYDVADDRTISRDDPLLDPDGPPRDKSIFQRVLRGGSTNRGPESHRCAFRSHVYPENTNVDAGFRCVRRLQIPFTISE